MWGSIIGGIASSLFGGDDGGGGGGGGGQQQQPWHVERQGYNNLPEFYKPSSGGSTDWRNQYTGVRAEFGTPNPGAGMNDRMARNMPKPPPYMPSPQGYLPQLMPGQKWGDQATDQQKWEWDSYKHYSGGSPVHNIGMNLGHFFRSGRWN